VENGDTYRIRPVDTLSSFFGTPATTLIRGGTSASTADTISIVSNGQSTTYFYNTGATPNRWSRVALGSPNANTNTVPVGASIMINKRGSSGGYAAYENAAPYNLQ
jgi:hypothetical protein